MAAVGALDIDTTPVPLGDGTFRAELSRDWEIWGPNGGYLAVIALRAAGAATPLRRPVSFTAHFLGVAEFAPVTLAVRRVRETKRVASLAVSMTQEDRPILEALVWVTGGGDGIEHAAWTMPASAPPRELPTNVELMGEAELPPFRFWENLECRPLRWIADWANRPPGDFQELSWYRYTPSATFADPFVDAGRSLLLLDTLFWPAASRGHPANQDWYAPSVDIQARFHALEPGSEYLLVDAHSPVARDGLVGGAGAVWSESGALLATGGQQMLCRPARLNPNPVAPPTP
jgi:acyl-CoA thioesterase